MYDLDLKYRDLYIWLCFFTPILIFDIYKEFKCLIEYNVVELLLFINPILMTATICWFV